MNGFGYNTSSAHSIEPSSLVYKLAVFVLAVLYAGLLASTPIEGIADRQNYVEIAGASPVIFLRFVANGYLAIFTNEPVWLGLNSFLNLFFDAETIVRIFIFVPAFIVSYKVLLYKPNHFFLLILILLAPQIIKNFVIHLRQGVAIAFFIWGWFAQSRYTRIGCIALTPFIHSSFFFVIVLLITTQILQKIRFGADLRLIIYLSLGLVIGLIIGGLSQALGARQASNDTMLTDSGASGIAFVYWSIILILFVFQGKAYIKQYSYALAAILLYLSLYFLTPVAGRVFESSVLLVFLAGLSLTGWRKLGFISAFLLFTLAILASMTQQPMFGFAAEVS